jgi:hypothetical protein
VHIYVWKIMKILERLQVYRGKFLEIGKKLEFSL